MAFPFPRFIVLLSFFFFYSNFLFSQDGIIRGNVLDAETGEPIIYGNLQLVGTNLGATTDFEGFFSLSKVPAGTYRLVATYLGYDSLSLPIKIQGNQILYRRINLQPNSIELSTVDVSAQKERAKTEVQVSALTVTPKQITALPSIGGQADIAQYLPVLPGVIFTGDQGGQLYIRGGSPVQNKILLDGMTIYNPFHSLGFFSVFETETIRSVDVLTGGFNADYGGRVSAVVDIKTREGNKKRFGGSVAANPFQAKVLLEGPIVKLDETKGNSLSFLLTGKHAYIDETSPNLYPYAVENDSLGLPFNFTDLYGKLSFVGANGSKINLFGFNFKDQVNFENLANLDWNTFGAGLQFSLIPNNASAIVNGNFSFSNYDIGLFESDNKPRTSGISSFTAGLDFTFFGYNSEVNYGFEINGFRTEFEFINFLDFTIEQFENTTELSGFVKFKKQWGNLIIEPGLRAQFYASLGDFSLEPRLGLKYNISNRVRFKLAGGMYSQNLISTVNERDIVNLFVGFLSAPDEGIFKPNTNERTDDRLQRANHLIAGVEVDLGKNVEVNIEPYLKDFTQIINLNRNKLTAQDSDYAVETGEAYGVDFTIKYQTPTLYLWGTYSWGNVNRNDGEQVYPTIFDRRHNVNLLGTYNFGNNSWEASVRWNMGSGFPFTLTQGFYGLNNFENGISTDVLTENSDLGIIYDERRNAGRLPYYHRLDASLKKMVTFSRYASLEIVLSVTNAYNRENIFFFDRVRYERQNQLPILPSLGFTLKF
ncbi:MAG: carboxypeptidase-like regulatory domain-containing protein [Bacteroidota bacterium]